MINKGKRLFVTICIFTMVLGLSACGETTARKNAEVSFSSETQSPVDLQNEGTEVLTEEEVIEEITPVIQIEATEYVTQLDETSFEVRYLDYQDNANSVADLFTVSIEPEADYTVKLYESNGVTEIAEAVLPIDNGSYTIKIACVEYPEANTEIKLDVTGAIPGVFTKADFSFFGYKESDGADNLIDYMNAHPNGGGDGDVFKLSHNQEECAVPQNQVETFRTNRGIGMGSTLEEVLRAYGEHGVEEFSLWGDTYNTNEHKMTKRVRYVVETESGAGVQMEMMFDQNDELMVFMLEGIYKKYMGDDADMVEFR